MGERGSRILFRIDEPEEKLKKFAIQKNHRVKSCKVFKVNEKQYKQNQFGAK